jgi:nucleoside-diphosphate-sugar epimerase
MKILVTGATGYVGTAVAAALARDGHAICALSRSAISAHLAEKAGHAAIRGDLFEPAAVAAATRSADAVVWCATSSDADTDAAAVDAALGALADTGKLFLYTSGAWVHGDTHGRVADESSPLHAPPGFAWRIDVERAVIAAHGLRSVVVRPGIVYGGGGGVPAALVEWARRDGVVRMPGGGDNHWSVVHLDDLADLYVRAVGRAPARSTFLAVHRSERFRDVAIAASQAAGVGGAVAAWPIDEARATLGDLAGALALDQRLSSAHALRQLEWRPSRVDLVTDLSVGSYRSRSAPVDHEMHSPTA